VLCSSCVCNRISLKLETLAIRDSLQLEAPDVALVVPGFNYNIAHFAPAYKFNNSTRDVSAIGEHLSMFWPNLYCACAETAVSDLFLSKF